MEFEKVRMHFLSELFPAVAVVVAYAPQVNPPPDPTPPHPNPGHASFSWFCRQLYGYLHMLKSCKQSPVK